MSGNDIFSAQLSLLQFVMIKLEMRVSWFTSTKVGRGPPVSLIRHWVVDSGHKHNYVSQFTMETYCFADGLCLFKQPQSVIYHWNQHDEEILKKCRSVCPIVTLTKKAYSSIIDSRKIIRISGERVYLPLQENEETVL